MQQQLEEVVARNKRTIDTTLTNLTYQVSNNALAEAQAQGTDLFDMFNPSTDVNVPVASDPKLGSYTRKCTNMNNIFYTRHNTTTHMHVSCIS